jgi:hypothetical protein
LIPFSSLALPLAHSPTPRQRGRFFKTFLLDINYFQIYRGRNFIHSKRLLKIMQSSAGECGIKGKIFWWVSRAVISATQASHDPAIYPFARGADRNVAIIYSLSDFSPGGGCGAMSLRRKTI